MCLCVGGRENETGKGRHVCVCEWLQKKAWKEKHEGLTKAKKYLEKEHGNVCVIVCLGYWGFEERKKKDSIVLRYLLVHGWMDWDCAHVILTVWFRPMFSNITSSITSQVKLSYLFNQEVLTSDTDTICQILALSPHDTGLSFVQEIRLLISCCEAIISISSPCWDLNHVLHERGCFSTIIPHCLLHHLDVSHLLLMWSHQRANAEHMTTSKQLRDNFVSLFPFGKPLESRSKSMLFSFCCICSVMEWSMICTLITMNYSYSWL